MNFLASVLATEEMHAALVQAPAKDVVHTQNILTRGGSFVPFKANFSDGKRNRYVYTVDTIIQTPAMLKAAAVCLLRESSFVEKAGIEFMLQSLVDHRLFDWEVCNMVWNSVWAWVVRYYQLDDEDTYLDECSAMEVLEVFASKTLLFMEPLRVLNNISEVARVTVNKDALGFITILLTYPDMTAETILKWMDLHKGEPLNLRCENLEDESFIHEAMIDAWGSMLPPSFLSALLRFEGVRAPPRPAFQTVFKKAIKSGVVSRLTTRTDLNFLKKARRSRISELLLFNDLD
jgi:hypothetical protein